MKKNSGFGEWRSQERFGEIPIFFKRSITFAILSMLVSQEIFPSKIGISIDDTRDYLFFLL